MPVTINVNCISKTARTEMESIMEMNIIRRHVKESISNTKNVNIEFVI